MENIETQILKELYDDYNWPDVLYSEPLEVYQKVLLDHIDRQIIPNSKLVSINPLPPPSSGVAFAEFYYE